METNEKYHKTPQDETDEKGIDYDLVRFRHRVLEAIGNRKTTVKKVEEKLQFANGSIAKFDRSAPSAIKVKQLAEYLDISSDYLLGLSDIPLRYEKYKYYIHELSLEQEKRLEKFLIKLLNELPQKGSIVVVDGQAFTVEKSDGDTLLLKVKPLLMDLK